MLTYTVSAALYMLFGPQAERNIFLTQPPLFAALGALLKFAHRQSYILVLMDLSPDIAVLEGSLREHSLLTRILKVMSRFSLRHADKIWTIGRCQRELLIALGISPARIKVIPN